MKNSILMALLFGTVCAAAGQVAFKLGATGRESFLAFFNGWIVVGMTLYLLGTAMWLFALSKADLTVVYPFTALTFVLVFAAGVLFFGEPATTRQLSGVGLILAGLYLIAVK